jgi:hypothetical protein
MVMMSIPEETRHELDAIGPTHKPRDIQTRCVADADHPRIARMAP